MKKRFFLSLFGAMHIILGGTLLSPVAAQQGNLAYFVQPNAQNSQKALTPTPLNQVEQVSYAAYVPQQQYIPSVPAPPPEAQPNPPVYAQAVPTYPEKSLEQLSAEIAALRKEIGKKSDKPDPKKGFTAPKFGGRVFIDSIYVANQNDESRAAYGQGINNFGFREARLTATGTGYDFLDYKLELGFENWESDGAGKNGTVNFKDMFLGIQHVPVLEYVRIGNQYVEDGGSEIANGTTNYTFMEMPSPAGNQFTSRRLGISSRHLFAQDRGRLFLGAYGSRNVSEAHRTLDNVEGITLNARLTYAPMYTQDGRCLFLFGGYYNFTDQGDVGNRYRAQVRPGGWDVGYSVLDTQGFNASNYNKAGFEVVYQNNGFCVQTDWFLQHYTDAASAALLGPADSKTNYGGFVMVRQFLTPGDYRKYSKESACWGAPVVSRPLVCYERGSLNCFRGMGAWEIAAYYGYYNNDDFTPRVNNTVRYGEDHEIGLALNWYWNPQLKWCLNYIHQISDIKYYAAGDIDTLKPQGDYLGISCRFNF